MSDRLASLLLEDFPRKMNSKAEKKLTAFLTYKAVSQSDERTQKKTKFNPKFNVREEFVLWIRDQFPALKKHANSGRSYSALEERKNEVLEAANIAVEDSSSLIDRPCQYEYFYKGYQILADAINNTNIRKHDPSSIRKVARTLRNFVKRIDAQEIGKQGFPYNDQKKRGEYDYGCGGVWD